MNTLWTMVVKLKGNSTDYQKMLIQAQSRTKQFKDSVRNLGGELGKTSIRMTKTSKGWKAALSMAEKTTEQIEREQIRAGKLFMAGVNQQEKAAESARKGMSKAARLTERTAEQQAARDKRAKFLRIDRSVKYQIEEAQKAAKAAKAAMKAQQKDLRKAIKGMSVAVRKAERSAEVQADRDRRARFLRIDRSVKQQIIQAEKAGRAFMAEADKQERAAIRLGRGFEASSDRLAAKNAADSLRDDKAHAKARGRLVDAAIGDQQRLNREVERSGRAFMSSADRNIANKPFSTRMNVFGKSMISSGRDLRYVGRDLSMYVTLPLVALGAAAAKAAIDFEKAMTKIKGLTKSSDKQVSIWSEEILELGPKLGKTPQELAESLYYIASSNIAATEAMDLLTVAAKTSAAGLGSMEDITKSLVFAVNAYGKEGMTAARAADIFTAAIGEGTIEIDQFNQKIGRIMPQASAMGVELEEVAGLMAALSLTGANASEAVVNLQGLFTTLRKPTKQARDQLEALNEAMGFKGANRVTFGSLRDMAGGPMGIVEVLRKLEEMTQGDEEALYRIVGDIRPLRGAMNILAQEMGVVNSVMKEVKDSGGRMEDALSKAAETTQFKLNQATAQVNATLIQMGNDILPIIADALEVILPLMKQWTEWWTGLSKGTKEWIIYGLGAVAAIGPLTFALGGLVTVVGALTRGAGFAALAGGMGLAAGQAALALRPMMALGLAFSTVASGVTTVRLALTTLLATHYGTKWALEFFNVAGIRDFNDEMARTAKLMTDMDRSLSRLHKIQIEEIMDEEDPIKRGGFIASTLVDARAELDRQKGMLEDTQNAIDKARAGIRKTSPRNTERINDLNAIIVTEKANLEIRENQIKQQNEMISQLEDLARATDRLILKDERRLKLEEAAADLEAQRVKDAARAEKILELRTALGMVDEDNPGEAQRKFNKFVKDKQLDLKDIGAIEALINKAKNPVGVNLKKMLTPELTKEQRQEGQIEFLMKRAGFQDPKKFVNWVQKQGFDPESLDPVALARKRGWGMPKDLMPPKPPPLVDTERWGGPREEVLEAFERIKAQREAERIQREAPMRAFEALEAQQQAQNADKMRQEAEQAGNVLLSQVVDRLDTMIEVLQDDEAGQQIELAPANI